MSITIDQAIELLEKAKDDPDSIEITDLFDAEDLGIEALKGIKKVRKTLRPYVEAPLPGETK